MIYVMWNLIYVNIIHYYKLKEEDKDHYLSMYITKLPYPANEFIMGRFIREINRGTIENNFG